MGINLIIIGSSNQKSIQRTVPKCCRHWTFLITSRQPRSYDLLSIHHRTDTPLQRQNLRNNLFKTRTTIRGLLFKKVVQVVFHPKGLWYFWLHRTYLGYLVKQG
jgi:hypothetical protein